MAAKKLQRALVVHRRAQARSRGRSRDGADFPVPAPRSKMPPDYPKILADLKERIRAARIGAAVAINQELLLLYYSIGLDLHLRFQEESWGSGIIDRVSADLLEAFPEMEGLSTRNLRRMRAFYRAYPLSGNNLKKWPRAVAKLDLIDWPPPVAKLPWAHNVILMEKVKDATLHDTLLPKLMSGKFRMKDMKRTLC